MKPGDSSVLAIDLETTGLDAHNLAQEITLVGLASAKGVVVFDYRKLSNAQKLYFYERLAERKLTAFNAVFDAAWLTRDYNRLCGRPVWDDAGWLPWEMCSLALFKHLANEGFFGQSWGLETFQAEVLGWPDGGQKQWLKDALKIHGLRKHEMWRLADLAPQAFASYCGQDADAAFQGYAELVAQCKRLGDLGATVANWHKKYIINKIRYLVQQQLRGLKINVPKLERYRESLANQIQSAEASFFQIPEVAAAVAEYTQAVLDAHQAKEPPKWTKAGAVTKRWQAWQSKFEGLDRFNPNSTKQLAWLLFDKLGYTPVKVTESGAPAVSKDVLPQFGEPGRVLASASKLKKELGYVEACLEVTQDGVLHPQLKSVGTVSGRISAGKE